MRDIVNKTVLITGASSGIGRALAVLFAERGNDLVVVARRAEQLHILKEEIESKHPIRVIVMTADLSVAGAANAIIDELRSRSISIDVLVNNAGYEVSGDFHQNELSKYFDMMRVSIDSSMTLIHGLVAGMIEHGFGRVLTISSMAGGMYAVKGHAVYVAAKAFLIRLSLSLNEEHRSNGVQFTVVCPGVVDTPFHDRADTTHMVSNSRPGLVLSADATARNAYRALASGVPYLVSGMPAKAMLLLIKWLPISWGIRLVATVL